MTDPTQHLRHVIAIRRESVGKAAAGLDSVMAALLGTDSTHVSTSADRRARLVDAVQAAKAAGKPILVVVRDADQASVEELERVRVGIEVNAHDSVRTIRLVLVGTQKLLDKLSTPAASGLRSRIAAHIEAGRPSSERHAVGSRARRLTAHAAVLITAIGALTMIPRLQKLLALAIDGY
jgi:type II secretory pathway predicted ATPase ExeA